MTSSPSCETSARATSSVVVPMLMNSEQPLGISAAAAAADRALLGRGNEATGRVGEVLDARGHDGAAMHAAERPTLAEIIEILADGLGGDLEAAREIVDRHAAERVREFHDFGLPQRKCHLSEKYSHAAGLETANAGG